MTTKKPTPAHIMLEHYLEGFRQSTDTSCGPASVILAAIGLGLDYCQENCWQAECFAQWLPVHDFHKRGMALHELGFLSEIIFARQLEVRYQRAYPANDAVFKDDIQRATKEQQAVVVVNFLQDDFVDINSKAKDGSPHYSPVMNSTSSHILVADVDFNITYPYWVHIEDMFNSMAKINPAYNLPRGWLVLRKVL